VIIVPVVVDVQAVGIEIADVDMVAIRIHILPTSICGTGTQGLPLIREPISFRS